MKKVIAILLVLVMALPLCACGQKREYYELNEKIPVPSGLELIDTQVGEGITSYFYQIETTDEEKAEDIFREYISVLEEEGIRLEQKDDFLGSVTYVMFYNDKTIGLTSWYINGTGFTLAVSVVETAG